jgi:hypothetical protein
MVIYAILTANLTENKFGFLAHLTERTLPVKKFNTPRRKTTPLKISTKGEKNYS